MRLHPLSPHPNVPNATIHPSTASVYHMKLASVGLYQLHIIWRSTIITSALRSKGLKLCQLEAGIQNWLDPIIKILPINLPTLPSPTLIIVTSNLCRYLRCNIFTAHCPYSVIQRIEVGTIGKIQWRDKVCYVVWKQLTQDKCKSRWQYDGWLATKCLNHWYSILTARKSNHTPQTEESDWNRKAGSRYPNGVQRLEIASHWIMISSQHSAECHLITIIGEIMSKPNSNSLSICCFVLSTCHDFLGERIRYVRLMSSQIRPSVCLSVVCLWRFCHLSIHHLFKQCDQTYKKSRGLNFSAIFFHHLLA